MDSTKLTIMTEGLLQSAPTAINLKSFHKEKTEEVKHKARKVASSPKNFYLIIDKHNNYNHNSEGAISHIQVGKRFFHAIHD